MSASAQGPSLVDRNSSWTSMVLDYIMHACSCRCFCCCCCCCCKMTMDGRDYLDVHQRQFPEDSGRSGPLWPKHQHTRAYSAHSRGYWQTFYACCEKHETLLLERAPSASEIKKECTSSSRSIRRAHIHRIPDPQPENTVHGSAPRASPAAVRRW